MVAPCIKRRRMAIEEAEKARVSELEAAAAIAAAPEPVKPKLVKDSAPKKVAKWKKSKKAEEE